MKVLLLHPEDRFPAAFTSPWDVIVDLGRAPVSIYQDWSRQANCPVFSLYDFAEDRQDLCRAKALLQLGMGEVVDRFGIDWWDVSSLLIVNDLLRSMLVPRLAKQLGTGIELYASRPDPVAIALVGITGGELHTVGKRGKSILRRARRYYKAFVNLDFPQISQVFQDKFDSEHKIRRRLSTRRNRPEGPVTLLPSAYINVSRMAAAYAAMLPKEHFLLVCARDIGKLQSLPGNVTQVSLDPYFTEADPNELRALLQRWDLLKSRLISAGQEFSAAEMSGALGRVSGYIRSGVASRDAWNRVFESENVTACLCTDDTAPYSRIPLILAKSRNLPALACHHGALDQRMAIKTFHADCYLAKGKMEYDYLVRVCQIQSEKIVMGGPAATIGLLQTIRHASYQPCFVFFSEPYEAGAWRSSEVYRDLLPRLCSLSKSCGLKMVFKLHPFESQKSVRRLLRRFLPKIEERKIDVITGPISEQLWQNAKFAMTVQSTVALECSQRGVPVFLCGWLQELYGGYIKQYSRFDIGYVLDSAEQINDVPRVLAEHRTGSVTEAERQIIVPSILRDLLRGKCSISDMKTRKN